MNPQPDLQSLLDDINSILPQASNRLPWSMPKSPAKQLQVLERVRDYLLHQQITASTDLDPRLHELVSQQVQQELQAWQEQTSAPNSGMGVEALEAWGRSPQPDDAPNSFSQTQQQEIMSSFSALMHELQEGLHQQMQEAFNQINSQIVQINHSRASSIESSKGLSPDLSPSFVVTPDSASRPGELEDLSGFLSPQDRWENMQLLQQQSDQLLLAIDTNQRVIFETLQRHLQTYQQSLTTKLADMYQLGKQTEVVFSTLVQQLVQQMETELAARQKIIPQLSSPQSSYLVPENLDSQNEAIVNKLVATNPLGNSALPTSHPALSFVPAAASPEGAASSEIDNQDQQAIALPDSSGEVLDLPWAAAETNLSESDLDALINLHPEVGNPTPPEDIDGILASLNTPLDAIAQDQDTIPDGGAELYDNLFSLVLEEDPLESALFGDNFPEANSAIVSGPEDISWEMALFATESPTLAPASDSVVEPEVVRQLTDLIDPTKRPEVPELPPPIAEAAPTPEDLATELGWGEEMGGDRYIPAAPEENLLVTSTPPNPETEIALEDELWAQLDQDLKDFEAGIPTTATTSIPSDSSLPPPTLPEAGFVGRSIADELLAEDWQEPAAALIIGAAIITAEISAAETPTQTLSLEAELPLPDSSGFEASARAEQPELPLLPETQPSAPLPEANAPQTQTHEPEIVPQAPQKVLSVVSPETEAQASDRPVAEFMPPEISPSLPSASAANLDLDPEELAFLEGISVENAPSSESALIAQLLMDEALDQELAMVKPLGINLEANPEVYPSLDFPVGTTTNFVVSPPSPSSPSRRDREVQSWQEASALNPEDPDLLELFAVESFDRNDLEAAIDGDLLEELADFPALQISISPYRLIKSEDETLTEIPNDEDEADQLNDDRTSGSNLEANPESISESESEMRFLDNGELLLETEAHIETNYPLRLDEAELMEMVWNQILDRPQAIEESETGEYSSQEVLDLELQDALKEGFPEGESPNAYLETGLENNDREVANLSSNLAPSWLNTTGLINPHQYRIPQAAPILVTQLNSDSWYLGIDVGTTSLEAVLLNQTTGELYPLYWQPGGAEGGNLTNYSLPTGIYGNPQALVEPPLVYAVGLGVPEDLTPDQMLYQNFKPYLDLGIPAWTAPGWQPKLRLAQNQPLVSIHWLQQATQELLRALSSTTAATQHLRATGIDPEVLVNILDSIAGVVLNCPVDSSDAYRWNLREAVLGAQLVAQPEQVVFIEEAIAPFLATLQVRHGEEATPLPLRGYTLVINSGAIATEFVLVDSTQPQSLTHEDFGLWSFPYAGNALDQDIICQLLLSPATKLLQNVYETDKLLLVNDLELPAAGELETTQRQRLHYWLQSSAWGQTLLIAAQGLKLHLQTKTAHRLVLGTDQWLVHQEQFQSMVVIPFLQQLNQQLNSFLSATGIAEQNIFQVICAGGTVSGSLVDEWLKIKLPSALVLQQVGLPKSMMAAVGLASLPLYPQVCNQAQQYSDYFLLMELLRILPLEVVGTPAPKYRLEEITQLLERRGINTRACRDRLLQLLNGELPAGLIPQASNNIWITTASLQHPDYLALKSEKLFTQTEEHFYQPNLLQCRLWYKYMNAILATAQQKLEEPLIFDLGTCR